MTKKSEAIRIDQVQELLLQALETEKGGVEVYQTALRCVINDDLRKEWTKYLDQTKTHVEIVTKLCKKLDVDPNKETPGRGVVRHIGKSLVQAMTMALEAGNKEAAELVASECVTLAETKDHHNWELLGEVGKAIGGAKQEAIMEAHEEVEEEEDEHLYHTAGWSRELWMQSLGLPAVLPPPEEQKHVKSAIGAARAKHAREEMT